MNLAQLAIAQSCPLPSEENLHRKYFTISEPFEELKHQSDMLLPTTSLSVYETVTALETITVIFLQGDIFPIINTIS